MSFSPEQIAGLQAKLDPKHVADRTQAGRKLSYVEGWHVIAEANRIFGFDAWDRSLVSIKLLGEPRSVDGKARVGYMATVRITVRAGDATVTRDGTGFGSGIDKDVDQAHESALKEAETDAMKRALMTFGNPFGLALYDKTQASVGVSDASANSSDTTKSAPTKIGHQTPGGRIRRAGERLQDANEINAAMDALLMNMGKQSDPDALKAWATKQRNAIGSLPDKAFDEFMAAYEAEMSTLNAERIAV